MPRRAPGGEWRRYAAPLAFLAAVTIAVVLIRAGLDSGQDHRSTRPRIPPPPTTRIDTVSRGHTTTATKKKKKARTTATTPRYWTVRPGDTFGIISSQAGVSVARIEELNPNVSSTSLTIGEKIRIR